MARGAQVHPKAYLASKRNVKAGLVSRSKILTALEKGRRTIRELSKDTSLSYECISYHLKTMRKDRLVDREPAPRPYGWALTPYGQQRLPIS